MDEEFFEYFPTWEYASSIVFDPQCDLPKCEEQTYIEEVISVGVDRLWSISRFATQKIDVTKQVQVINALRARYVFPDILGLIGKPSPKDYREDGELTWRRKSQLLMIGGFEWQGMAIATHKTVFGYSLGDWYEYPAWKPEEEGWYVGLNIPRDTDQIRSFFWPFRNANTQSLLDLIAEQTLRPLNPRERALPIDGNVFNTHPENIRIISTRGRPMRCQKCKRRVTAEASMRVRVDGEYARHCKYCLDTIISHGDVSVFL